MSKLLEVPVIDISRYVPGTAAEKQAIAQEVDRACRDIGFLIIAGHGIDPDLIARMRDVSQRFFDLPQAEKHKVARPGVDVSRGYTGLEDESVARSRDANAVAGDLNESLMIGPVDIPDAAYAYAPAAGKHFAANIWPDQPAGLRPVWTEYYRAMGDLACTLMRIFALGLGLDEHYFDDKVDKHISRLRLRDYPAQHTAPKPGQIRAGAHSDYGSLTILCTEDKPGGLQVCNAEGDWVDVPIVPGTFVINIGDLMERWSNDRWVSTLHRVVNPPADAGGAARRLSIVFFHNPNYDTRIECLPGCKTEDESAKYAPTTSDEHLRSMFVTTQNQTM